jgi:tetratricopeptide (TPR) repeat protein
MGTVFRAVDQVDGATVALKIMQGDDAVDAERFAREAAILEKLEHPGIVRHVAHGAAPGGPRWVAMEWLHGEDLSELLARRKRLSPVEALSLARRAAEALGHAHAHGVVHRDVKPANLLLPDGDVDRVRLLDFGVARGEHAGQKLTRTGVVVGTPAYMAPEQIQAVGEPAPSADVFSLGCVLYECLAGRPAFEGTSLMARLAKILLQDAPRLRAMLPDAPAALDRLIARMLAKNPAKRPPDGAAVAEEIAKIAWEQGSWGSEIATLPSMAPPPDETTGPSLTTNEQRLATVVLAGDPHGRAARGTLGDDVMAELTLAIAPYGGHLDALAGGSLMVTAWGPGSAVDRAARAAACALALRARLPDLPISMTTGRGRVWAQVVEGDVIDQAVRALRGARPGAVRLDAVTAEMLRARFDVRREGDEAYLEREHAADEGTPLLLGRPTPYVGRARELATLEGMFEGCVEESVATAVLVVGDPGSGKTRLAREVLEKIRQRGEDVTVLRGRGDAVGDGSPFSMAAGVIQRAAGIRLGEPLAARREKLAARVGRHVAAGRRERVIAFLGAMSGTPFPSADEAVRAAGESPMLMGDSMRAAWQAWIEAECAAAAVVIVLDDVHWGDEASVRLVDATLKNLPDRPLMAVALARPEVHARFPELWTDRHAPTVALGPLARKVSERLVREALGEGAPAGATQQIVDRAAGNPFYLEELIRAVAAGRGDALPGSVLATVEARLDREGTDAKRVLRAASVFGERFSRDGVALLLGGAGGDEAGDLLDLLAAREIVARVSEEATGGDVDYVFRNDLVREAAYAMLTEPDRALGHRLAGEWLERASHPDDMAVAEHLRRGGEPARAVAWYRRAAERALEASDMAAVLVRVERGIACGAAGEDEGALRLCEAEAHVWRGELALAEERGRAAAALFPAGSVLWFRSVTQVGLAAGKQGAYDRVEAWIDPAASAPFAPAAVNARIACLTRLAICLIFGGRYEAVDALFAILDASARDQGRLDPQSAAYVHEVRATRATVAGDLGAGLEGFRAALSAYEQTQDQRNASTIRANLGFVLSELGSYADAEEALRAAFAAADRLDLHDPATHALHNLGRAVAYRGAIDEARALEQRALDAFTRQGDPRLSGSARAYLAQIELLAGDAAAAAREARAAAEALVAAPPLRAGALAVLARALLEQGRAVEALPVAREAYAQLELTGTLEEGESAVRLAYAEALRAGGEAAAFADVIALARAKLLDRAARISDPVWRERFLTAVPENARTLALAGG